MWIAALLPLAAAGPLVDRVVARAGDPYREPGLSFTFSTGDVARAYRWDIPGQKAEVSWTDKAGRACVAVVPVPYEGDDPLLRDAWALFVNDQYWLMAPSKLRDAGVHVVEVGNDLRVTFDHVGLTPGDHYTFHVDPSTADVTGWEFVLESGKTGAFSWAPSTPVGGLHLSLGRASPERKLVFTAQSGAVSLPKPGGACTAVEPTPPPAPPAP